MKINLTVVLGIIAFLAVSALLYIVISNKDVDDTEYTNKIKELEKQGLELKYSIDSIQSINVKLAENNDLLYNKWLAEKNKIKSINKKYDEELSHNDTISIDEHIRNLSEWLKEN